MFIGFNKIMNKLFVNLNTNKGKEMIEMELERILQIFNSKGVIDVTLKGNSVWIEGVNSKENSVNIKDLNTNEIKEVSVLDLRER